MPLDNRRRIMVHNQSGENIENNAYHPSRPVLVPQADPKLKALNP